GYADPDFTRIFDFKFVEGDAKALDSPNGVILTRETAQRLFGNKPALGRPLVVEGRDDATVPGVIEDVRQPSVMGQDNGVTMRFDAIRQWNTLPDAKVLDTIWTAMTAHMIIKLKPGASLDAMRTKFPAFLERTLPPSGVGVAKFFM